MDVTYTYASESQHLRPFQDIQAQEALGWLPQEKKQPLQGLATLTGAVRPSVSVGVASGVVLLLPTKPQLHKSFPGFRKNQGFIFN